MRCSYWPALVLAPLFAFACGTENGSEFPQAPASDNGPTSSGGPAGAFGNTNARTDAGSSSGNTGNEDGSTTCAAVNAQAKLTPVNMIVMYDRSGSMGDLNESPTFDPTKRWNPVGEAMKAFFGDTKSTGMSASLTFFPKPVKDNDRSCDVADYATAQVPLTPLPSSTFATTIDATKPRGDTPTRPAMRGAIDQAKAAAASKPDEKTVIVLVTDGEPWGCTVAPDPVINNTTKSDAEAAKVATEVKESKVLTYVVGVGPSVENLKAVATAGGTTLIPVTVGNADTTKDELIARLAEIRGQLASCDFAIPAPPDGRTLDFDKVFVQRTPTGKPVETLPYDQACTNGGWRFDDPKAPKKVLLCESTCNAVRADTGGKINVQFACVSRPPDQIPPR